jgi:superfamily I DNA/RNA helicase
LLFDAPQRRRSKASKPAAPEVARATAIEDARVPAASGRAAVLAALDPDQADAAAAVDGPVMVIAGPGSGKTRMLVHRLAYLVLERGVPASSLLAVTFTRRATEEMRSRLEALLPPDAGACAIHSFHSLGLSMLRADGAAFGLAPDFRIADERERRAALAADLQVGEGKAARLLRGISVLKRTGAVAEGEAAEALAACARLGRERNWVDFDDLVGLSVELLETHPEIAARWCDRFSHICADEFQDIDERQYRLLQLIAGPDGNVCVIGDPNQAIYGFRGADAGCFERFRQDFPAVRTLRLDRNYRSSGTIVRAAAQVIRGDGPGDLVRPMLEPIAVHTAPDDRAEAEFVAATIEELLGGHDLLAANRAKPAKGKAARPLGFGDFAVLYRTDAQAAVLREAFDQAGIPFRKSSPARIDRQPAVRALLAALEGDAADATPDLAARIAAAAEELRQGGEIADAASIAEARRRLVALAQSRDVGNDEARLAEQVAMATEADFWDARADRVSLLTMHAAKGLEFPVVFVVGCEDGIVPFRWGIAERDEDEAGHDASAAEERRLFYVAMTRARDRLFVSRAAQRSWRGRPHQAPPSPFLKDIATELTAMLGDGRQRRRPERHQYSLF